VLDFVAHTGRLTAQDSVSADDLAAVEALIATDVFERIGVRRERMNWPEYARYLAEWAGATGFESRLVRIDEANGAVFLELEERLTQGGKTIEQATVMVFEFAEDDRIRRMRVYYARG
jgi:hypothetical protein